MLQLAAWLSPREGARRARRVRSAARPRAARRGRGRASGIPMTTCLPALIDGQGDRSTAFTSIVQVKPPRDARRRSEPRCRSNLGCCTSRAPRGFVKCAPPAAEPPADRPAASSRRPGPRRGRTARPACIRRRAPGRGSCPPGPGAVDELPSVAALLESRAPASATAPVASSPEPGGPSALTPGEMGPGGRRAGVADRGLAAVRARCQTGTAPGGTACHTAPAAATMRVSAELRSTALPGAQPKRSLLGHCASTASVSAGGARLHARGEAAGLRL
jgi:hypothetical protein